MDRTDAAAAASGRLSFADCSVSEINAVVKLQTNQRETSEAQPGETLIEKTAPPVICPAGSLGDKVRLGLVSVQQTVVASKAPLKLSAEADSNVGNDAKGCTV